MIVNIICIKEVRSFDLTNMLDNVFNSLFKHIAINDISIKDLEANYSYNNQCYIAKFNLIVDWNINIKLEEDLALIKLALSANGYKVQEPKKYVPC